MALIDRFHIYSRITLTIITKVQAEHALNDLECLAVRSFAYQKIFPTRIEKMLWDGKRLLIVLIHQDGPRAILPDTLGLPI